MSSRSARLPRQFLILLSASGISFLGDGLSIVAYPWLASRLSDDAVFVVGAVVARRLPWLLLSLPIGVLVDRVDRRRLMIALNVLRAAMTAAVAVTVFTGSMTLALLYASALAIGVADVAYAAAAEAMTGQIVPRDLLPRANGKLLGGQVLLAQLAGPPIGGLLIGGLGLGLALAGDAASFALAAAALLPIRGAFKAATSRRAFRADVLEGVRYLRRVPILRTLALTLAVFNLVVTMVSATLVLYAREVLHLGSTGYGLLLAAGATGGAVGSLGADWASRRLGVAVALNAVPVLGTACYLTMAAAPVTALVAMAALVLNSTVIVWNVVAASLRQTLTPGALIGRVSSASRWLGWGTMSVGALLGGVLTHFAVPFVGRDWALRSPMLVAAVILLVTFAVTARAVTGGTAALAAEPS